MTSSLFGEPEARVILCPLVTQMQVPPSRKFTLDECGVCAHPVWVGPQQRQLINEFCVRDLEWTIRCLEHRSHGIQYDDQFIVGAGFEADRLALLRGATPRGPLVVVTSDDLAEIQEANPGRLIVARFPPL